MTYPFTRSGPPGQITSPVFVIVMSIVTCGVYYFYWYYKIRSELREYTGDTAINPGIDLLLGLITCTLWFFYVDYTNGQLIARLQAERGITPNDVSTLALVMDVIGFTNGFTTVLSSAFIQSELNRLWAANGAV